MSRRKKPFYNVRPRYTCGSPAMVPLAIAIRVARQEERAYDHARAGHCGEAARVRAEQQGLLGIAEEVVEYRRAWQVRDLITHDVYTRPFRSMK